MKYAIWLGCSLAFNVVVLLFAFASFSPFFSFACRIYSHFIGSFAATILLYWVVSRLISPFFAASFSLPLSPCPCTRLHCFCFIKCQFNMLPLHLDAGTQFTWAQAARHRRKRWRAEEENAWLCFSCKGCKRTMLCVYWEENWKAHRLCICLQKVQNINSILQCSIVSFSVGYIVHDGPIDRQLFALRPSRKDTHTPTHPHLHWPHQYCTLCSNALLGSMVFSFNCIKIQFSEIVCCQTLARPLLHICVSTIYLRNSPSCLLLDGIAFTQYLFLGTLKRLNSGVMRMRVQHYMQRGGGEPTLLPSLLQHLIQE